jgi:uncharacterized protein (TIGR02271 family)
MATPRRVDITIGSDVYTLDHQRLGTVTQLDGDFVVVHGPMLQRELYVPRSAFVADGSGLCLNAGMDQLGSQGWETAREAQPVTTTQTLDLHEEELSASKHAVQAGEVEVGKRIVTEERSMDVPVTHEELEIERRPGDRRPAADFDSGTTETISVPLMTEEIEVEKRAVVREEVTLKKKPVTEVEHVTDTVRREEPDVRDSREPRL